MCGASNSLYADWVKAVNGKQCRHSIEATREFIQKRIAPKMTGSKTNDPRLFDVMRKAFHARAIADSHMTPNPNWSNGYFIEDQETAELMDSVNAFGGEHGVLHVPMHWNDEQCQNHINGLLAEQAA